MVTAMRSLDTILNTPRLRADIARQVRNFHFEHTDGGIYMPKARLHIGGAMTHTVNGADPITDKNLITTQGIQYLLDNGLGATFYIAPFVNNVEPVAGLTAANFNSTQDEFTAYTSSTRVAWTKTRTNQTFSNSTSPAQFVTNAANSTIWGGGVLTVATKEAATGTLLAAVKFSAARVLPQSGDVLGIVYELTGADDGE